MSVCDRFEKEGLERFVAGEPPDAHVESCPDCRSARASYQALATALAKAGEAEVPDGAWEAKVWARIQQQGVRRRPWAILVGLGAAAAALAVFFVQSAGGPEVLAFSTVQVERGPGAPVRGGPSRPGDVQSAAPGDVLHLVAKVPRGKVADLRVYRGTDELVFQCATTTACIRTGDTLEARVKLDRAGTYRSVAFAADRQLPAATGHLDADTAAGMRAGSASESPPIDVL
jgi:hypothetical protein